MDYSFKESERFWSKVKKTDNCWEWIGAVMPNKYGAFNNTYAHRYSYLLHYGSFNRKLFVCHKCDNPSCVRPDHLFLGTPKDNVLDMIRKGRAKYREQKTHCNNEHKFTKQNTYNPPSNKKKKVCRECQRIRHLKSKALRMARYRIKRTKLYTKEQIFAHYLNLVNSSNVLNSNSNPPL